MNPSEIITNNTLIRDFMEVDAFEYDEWKVAQLTEGRYHISYDWLMPVVEKINKITINENVFTVVIGDCITKIINSSFQSNINYDTIVSTGNTIHESIYKSTIQFIKYYNESKNI